MPHVTAYRRKARLIEPVLAGVYVGLASVGVAGIGVCVTVYLHIRRKDDSDDDT
jgi:hypothetical protein